MQLKGTDDGLISLYNGMAPDTGSPYQAVDDRIMGGRSVAQATVREDGAGQCICLSGTVSLARGGGFVQVKWPVDADALSPHPIEGVYLEVRGSAHAYNVHLRTRQLWLPWQSFRNRFTATDAWKLHRLPLAAFTPYRTDEKLDAHGIRSVGIVAIGEAFTADVCVRQLGFYVS